jgi:competence protein ComEA
VKYFVIAFLLSFAATAWGQAVDLNHAPLSALETLPGIGAKRANAIVAFREHRPFRRPQELLRIKGIGPRLFARLKSLVIAEDSALGHAASSRAEPLSSSHRMATAAQ